MIRHLHLILLAALGTFGFLQLRAVDKPASKPLRALLVCGGCCHDYARQSVLLRDGIQARANVQVDVIQSEDKSVSPQFPHYQNKDWAKGYDIIIHDECAAGIKDVALVNNIIEAHKTIPAVNLHCAMHSFRTGTDAWFKYLGLQSASHGPQEPIAISFVEKHPITETLSDWTTIKEELYNNVNVFDAKPLAMGKQIIKAKDGTTKEADAIVVWTNETQGARSFSTTIGHNNDTVADARYLDLVTRGLLWACNKLNADYLTPYTGPAGTFVVLPAAPKKEEPKAAAATPPVAAKDATLVTITASSEESGKGNFAWKAIDGKADTRWCASDASMPQWLQLAFEKPQDFNHIRIEFESSKGCYPHKLEGSTDGKNWKEIYDATGLDKNPANSTGFIDLDIKANALKFLKITVVSCTSGGWSSIKEVTVKGEGIKSISPKNSVVSASSTTDKSADPFAKEGNITPKIVKLTPEQEAEIMKDVKVADGFEATLFANSAAANYPVYVAAAPDGTLYVSSDGNGSLGRNPKRGRIIRLRDLDGDGRADETKVFCEVDSPRGLVWDHDRLYLVHPPHLSEFIDKDGDGVAEEQKVLVKDIAFGFADRPADHTTNGLSLGIDGWLYIAGGDFGFMKATGTDGKTLQHRGGGVIRVRPDGTGLEIYSTGTRNILEVAISPLMDIFARDNTNDGGGWNVRFHHFTGLDDHGYPRLYKNFNDEAIQPLADYGGGSGCGATYIDEPGFGKWNNAPFTADWGTGALWHHEVKPKGATFEETRKPEPFIKMTRPTDADVDGNSRVYCASWKGATFNWEGPDVGYIVQVKPKGFKAEPLPDFAKASDEELAKLVKIDNNSGHRRRLEAQRELLRRGSKLSGDYKADIADHRTTDRNLVEQLKVIADTKNSSAINEVIQQIGNADPVIAHASINALAYTNDYASALAELDRPASKSQDLLRALAKMHRPEVVSGLIDRLGKTTDTTLRQGILTALCRLHFQEGEWKGDSWGTRPDTRGPYYQPEAWSETPKITAILKETLSKASAEETAFLVKEMNRNRIQSNDALERILSLAKTDPKLVPDAVAQLSSAETIPADAVPMLINVLNEVTKASNPALTTATISQSITALAKTDSAEAVSASLAAFAPLKKMPESAKEFEAATKAFLESPKLENHHQLVEQLAEKMEYPVSLWADVALLKLSTRTSGSPESIQLTGKALDLGWQDAKRRKQILDAVYEIKHQPYANKVLAAMSDPDAQVKGAAERTAKAMRLQPKGKDTTPLVSSLKPEDVITQVLKTKGDVALGEQLFTRQTCIACHTVSEDQPQKGPYLGNIAQTYKRPELAQNIIDPNKTIAQGFASEVFTLKDGNMQMGFITLEGADSVKVRNITAQEFTYATKDIAKREKLPISMMPPGLVNTLTVHEFASLLDYLESLVKK
jgi:putative membrane-bound dehydrogenase-like protein